jgi:hypothetical protein
LRDTAVADEALEARLHVVEGVGVIADLEGPSFISRTVARSRVDRRRS